MQLGLRSECRWFIGKAAVINMFLLGWDRVPWPGKRHYRGVFLKKKIKRSSQQRSPLSAPSHVIPARTTIEWSQTMKCPSRRQILALSCWTWPELRAKRDQRVSYDSISKKKKHCCHKVRSRGETISVLLFREEFCRLSLCSRSGSYCGTSWPHWPRYGGDMKGRHASSAEKTLEKGNTGVARMCSKTPLFMRCYAHREKNHMQISRWTPTQHFVFKLCVRIFYNFFPLNLSYHV